jgi:hypothetical protein
MTVVSETGETTLVMCDFWTYLNLVIDGAYSEPRVNVRALHALTMRIDRAKASGDCVIEVVDEEYSMIEAAARLGLGLSAAGRRSAVAAGYVDAILDAPTRPME